MAAISHGASAPTFDLDLCFERTVDNVERILDSLGPFDPRGRGTARTPLDERWLLSGMPALLETTAGKLDLLSNLDGLGAYPEFASRCVIHELYDLPIRVLSLEDLIAAKRAAGRPKDLAVLHELAEILRQRDEA